MTSFCKLWTLLVLCSVLLWGGCSEDGNGVEATKSLELASFTKVVASDNFNLRIESGSRFEAEVTADENLLENYSFRAKDGVLDLFFDGAITPKIKPQAIIRMPVPLEAVSVREKCIVNVRQTLSPGAVVAATNDSVIIAQGQCDRAVFIVTEQGVVDGSDLHCGVVTVHANEDSLVFVRTSKQVVLDLAGHAEVVLSGTGEVVIDDVRGNASYSTSGSD